MGMVTGGQLVARMLKEERVRHVFTLSGLHVAPIYAGLVEEGIAVVDTRHEQAAAHAADAYARITRGVGVAVVAGWTVVACTGRGANCGEVADSTGAKAGCVGASCGITFDTAGRLPLSKLMETTSSRG